MDMVNVADTLAGADIRDGHNQTRDFSRTKFYFFLSLGTLQMLFNEIRVERNDGHDDLHDEIKA